MCFYSVYVEKFILRRCAKLASRSYHIHTMHTDTNMPNTTYKYTSYTYIHIRDHKQRHIPYTHTHVYNCEIIFHNQILKMFYHFGTHFVLLSSKFVFTHCSIEFVVKFYTKHFSKNGSHMKITFFLQPSTWCWQINALLKAVTVFLHNQWLEIPTIYIWQENNYSNSQFSQYTTILNKFILTLLKFSHCFPF